MTDNVGKKVICYNCRGEGHVSRQCKEKKRVKDSQYFKDKMLLMEAKEKGTVLDAEAKAFLADVECTAPYDQPLAITTTNMFEVSHEDAYDSDVDEGPHAAAAFMANLSSTSGTNGATTSQVNEVHTDANQIFDNVNHLLTHEMHQEEHLDSDVESDIDDNTIPYHQYQLDSEVQDVPTEVSSAPPGEISMITILDDLRTQLDGHLKVNQEQCLVNDSLRAELAKCKLEIVRLDTQQVKLDLERQVRQEQNLVTQRNARNAELEQEKVMLKTHLKSKDISIEFLKSENQKVLTDKKKLEDKYLDEIVCLKSANKVATDLLQKFQMPTHTIPMLSKKPKNASQDLHKDILGRSNPRYGKKAPVINASNAWDTDETLASAEVSMAKMKGKPGHVRPESGFYEKLNALKFVPQQELSREQVYWLPANEIASQASTPATPVTPYVPKSPPPSQVLATLHNIKAVFPQFDAIIKERTTVKPLYVSLPCYEYAKEFALQQVVPFLDYFKKHVQTADDTIVKEVAEFKEIHYALEDEYERCVLENKNLIIEKKNLLIKNDSLIAECLERDICSIVLYSDVAVTPSSNCSCDNLRLECDREHNKVLELEAEISKQKRLITESEKRFAFLEQNYVSLQLKFQNYKQCSDTSSASNAIFEINKLRDQLQGKDATIRNLDAQINIMKVLNVGSTEGSCDQQALDTDRIQLKDMITSLRIQLDGLKVENVSLKRRYDELSKANTHSRTAYTEKLSALTAEHTKLQAQVTGKTSSGPSTSETPKVLAPGMYNLGSKYIPPPKRANWVKPTPVPKKKHTKRFKRQPKKEWKPIKRVWQQISKPVANSKPQWKPTGRHFSLFEKYPLTRIMEPTDMPLELPSSASSSPQITMVVQIVLWYLDSGCSRHMTGDRARLINFVEKFIGTVRFGNDEYAAIIGYGDYKLGDTIISRVYYVEGLKHNLFSVGQFCDGGLEVAFRQHSCHIRNYDMVDLLNGSRTTNLYSISLNDMMSASPLGKSTERITSTKDGKHNMKFSEYYTYMWTCGPMRTESINGKKYVLVIVDDYTRFGWVRFLRSKDETPQVIEKFIVKTQRALNATVRFVRTDNGTEFVNKTSDGLVWSVGFLHEYERYLLVSKQNGCCRKTGNPNSYGSCSASHSNSVNIDVTPTTITYVPKMDSSTFRLKTIIGDKDRPVLTRETARKPSDVEEIHEFERLDVWILVPCPDNILIIPLKWIFKIKLDEYGDVIVENKARLVGGYRQEVVLILKKSFAPVARLEAIRDSSIDSRSEYETWSTSSRWT
ncbi:retrovirus-related pol polyprotein from transposon TNT 1-94 [Tanacetum coccineum]